MSIPDLLPLPPEPAPRRKAHTLRDLERYLETVRAACRSGFARCLREPLAPATEKCHAASYYVRLYPRFLVAESIREPVTSCLEDFSPSMWQKLLHDIYNPDKLDCDSQGYLTVWQGADAATVTTAVRVPFELWPEALQTALRIFLEERPEWEPDADAYEADRARTAVELAWSATHPTGLPWTIDSWVYFDPALRTWVWIRWATESTEARIEAQTCAFVLRTAERGTHQLTTAARMRAEMTVAKPPQS